FPDDWRYIEPKVTLDRVPERWRKDALRIEEQLRAYAQGKPPVQGGAATILLGLLSEVVAEPTPDTPTTTLVGAIDPKQAVVNVASADGCPSRRTFLCVVDGEVLRVKEVSGTTWTAARGAEGTIPAAHESGATVHPLKREKYNSALLIHADGQLGERYDKIHRVPFGEY